MLMFDLSYFVFFIVFLFVPPRLAFYLLLRSIKVYIKKIYIYIYLVDIHIIT